MANPLVLKASLGLGGVAVVAGASIGIPKLLAEKEQLISDLIKNRNPKKRLITATALSDPAWKKAGEAYRKANKTVAKGKDAFKLSDWNGPISTTIDSNTEALKSFSDACSQNSNKKATSSSQLYKDVLDYCTRDATLSDLVKEAGNTPLSKDKQANSAEGRGAWSAYVRDNPETTGDAGNISNYSSEKSKAGQSDNVSDDFRTKCTDKLGSTSIDDTKLLGEVMKGCTEPKTGQQ